MILSVATDLGHRHGNQLADRVAAYLTYRPQAYHQFTRHQKVEAATGALTSFTEAFEPSKA